MCGGYFHSNSLARKREANQYNTAELIQARQNLATSMHRDTAREIIIITIINPLTARVVGAPQMILQPVFSVFPCSPLPSWTCRTPGLSIPWCCLSTSSFVRLVFFPLSLCLARWFWPDLMNGRHDHTTAVFVSYDRQVIFMWSNCLLDLGMDFLVVTLSLYEMCSILR